MLELKYDPTRPYRFARYGRMSDPRQNKRSPDQQFVTIDETMTRLGYPWQCIASYRDDGISGRYLRKRPGLQRLLRDIEAGLIQVELVVVDTLERLGRSEEIADLRRKLLVDFAILIVAADTGFADPTGIIGKAIGMVEQIRSTENTRISRHNVIRGKKDAARRGRWPGGPVPFGYRLKPLLDTSVFPADHYNVLEPEPRAAAALRLAFERAATTSEGDLRLSKWWNANPEIPTEFKPINPFTMGYHLENPIAIGTLRWGAHQTGVVNDARVIERNRDGVELVTNFCPPTISVELYERVQYVRGLRGQQINEFRKKRFAAGARKPGCGLTLKYLLTGLVRCGTCNASMRPIPSGRRSKSGRRYVYYTCPRHYDGSCPNDFHVPEDRLRASVIAQLRARLFPRPAHQDTPLVWLPEILALVGREWDRLQDDAPDPEAADQEEMRSLDQQLSGWARTLANPQLPASVRADIELRYGQSKERQAGVQQQIAHRRGLRRQRPDVTAAAVVEALARLASILDTHNPTLGNLELGKHIARIVCFAHGRIEMVGTALGILTASVEVLAHGSASSVGTAQGSFPAVVPRRRGRLRVVNLTNDREQQRNFNVSPGEETVPCSALPDADWEEERIGPRQPWSQEHAVAVAEARASGKTHQQLAAMFGVSVPTIRKALRLAGQSAPASECLPRKMPRACWPERHVEEVAALAAQGMKLRDLCRHFQRSEPLIRRALQLAASRPQGR